MSQIEIMARQKRQADQENHRSEIMRFFNHERKNLWDLLFYLRMYGMQEAEIGTPALQTSVRQCCIHGRNVTGGIVYTMDANLYAGLNIYHSV